MPVPDSPGGRMATAGRGRTSPLTSPVRELRQQRPLGGLGG